jgi:cellulose synthase/poly-beta-1,6-N-acetylglucosamine synthase-like glycosyltransferase
MNPALGYDAFCILDADNLVDTQFLREMNNAFCNGARVAQARNGAKNPYDSWISGCYALYYKMANVLYSQARANIGLSAKIVGYGFGVRRDVIQEMGGWNTQTLTEDIEFSAQCAERGIKIAWVPDTVVYEEEPITFAMSMRQRKRWCSGIVEVTKCRLPGLLRSLKTSGRPLKLDSVMFQVNPFVQVTAIFASAVNLILMIIPLASTPDFNILPLLILAAGGYLGGVVLGAVLLLCTGAWNRRLIKSVFTYPIFIASWLPLQLLAVLYKTTTWTQIDHTRSVSLSEVA